jgi:hypothetical protein
LTCGTAPSPSWWDSDSSRAALIVIVRRTVSADVDGHGRGTAARKIKQEHGSRGGNLEAQLIADDLPRHGRQVVNALTHEFRSPPLLTFSC